jgi:hypothetical protein
MRRRTCNKRSAFRPRLWLTTLVLLCGCGQWPEIVSCGEDIDSLPVQTISIRARGLADEDIPRLSRLQNLQILDFGGGHKSMAAKITDHGVRSLAYLQLPGLETLTLDHTSITDDGVCEAAQIKTVRWLSLMACSGVTDKGLSLLVTMTNLAALDLRGCTNITDSGVLHLSRMVSLKEVLLGGCKGVSIEGVESLRASLPACRVEKDEREWSAHQ